MTARDGRVGILIVAYRNAGDVRRCLEALTDAAPEPAFDVFVCENGGSDAVEDVCAALTLENGVCEGADDDPLGPPSPVARIETIRPLRMRMRDARVWVAQASRNLGYAGAINEMVEHALPKAGWRGVWILNPDTAPDPSALAELVKRAENGGKAMVGSTIVGLNDRERVTTRSGLRLGKFTARGTLLGRGEKAGEPVDVDRIEARLDCVSGASNYVTVEALRRVGRIDERFFLYFEDLDWGVRAKKLGLKLGYAPKSIVRHVGGSTLGSASHRLSMRSWLAIYLQSRNLIIFTRKHYPLHIVFSVLFSAVQAVRYLMSWSVADFKIELSGLWSGLNDEIGPPPRLVAAGLAERRPLHTPVKWRRVKISLSIVSFAILWFLTWLRLVSGGDDQGKLTILYYHSVHSDYLYEFHRQVSALKKWARVFPAEYCGPLSPAHVNVAITFDDAFRSIHANAWPILSAQSMPIAIFASVAFLGRKPTWWTEDESFDYEDSIMSAADLASLPPALVTIGSHTVNHRRLSTIAIDDVRQELVDSKTAMEAIFGRKIHSLSLPYGDATIATFAQGEAAGYQFVFSIDPRNNDPRRSGERGRVRVDPWDGPLEFYLKAHGAYAWLPLVKGVVGQMRAKLLRSDSNPTDDSAAASRVVSK